MVLFLAKKTKPFMKCDTFTHFVGLQVDLKTSNGSTALHNAANCGHSAVVKQLLQAGAGVGQCALTGANALFNAATAGHTECVEVLLEAGSIVDAVTTSGSTALHSAASNGHAEVVQRLIAAGADVDVQVCHVAFDISTLLLLLLLLSLLLLLLLLLCIYSTDPLHVHVRHVWRASWLRPHANFTNHSASSNVSSPMVHMKRSYIQGHAHRCVLHCYFARRQLTSCIWHDQFVVADSCLNVNVPA